MSRIDSLCWQLNRRMDSDKDLWEYLTNLGSIFAVHNTASFEYTIAVKMFIAFSSWLHLLYL